MSATHMLLAASAAQAGVSFMVLGLPSIGPQLRSEFDLSLAGLGALLAAMQLGSGLALVGAGRAVDRLGPARPPGSARRWPWSAWCWRRSCTQRPRYSWA